MSINFRKNESGWVLEAEQFFDLPREEIFEFFADAANLQSITPPWLNFQIVTPQPIEMMCGARIDYKLKLHFIPIKWQTEITAWNPPLEFTDRQMKGPYKKWIHEHTFVEQNGGTLMVDKVSYNVPLGRLVHSLIVKKDLKRIFQYRQRILADRFARS